MIGPYSLNFYYSGIGIFTSCSLFIIAVLRLAYSKTICIRIGNISARIEVTKAAGPEWNVVSDVLII